MSGSESMKLLVQAGDPASELFVIDRNFELVDRGVGRLEVKVPPGMYKVKVRTGNAETEEFLSLEPGGATLMGGGSGATLQAGPKSTVLTLPQQAFASTVPLDGTSQSREYHRDNARQSSREIHKRLGAGARLFIFTRTFSGKRSAKGTGARRSPSAGLSLHDLAGRRLLDIERVGKRDLGAIDPWVACSLMLAPGCYRLRFAGPVPLEQMIFAAPGWQTQVFLLRKPDSRRPGAAQLVPRISIMMARPNIGFDPLRPDLRLAELALTALTNQRGVVPSVDLDAMLKDKFADPMLGIYAAHLLLLRRKPDRPLLEVVVGNLKRLVGPRHPDVRALCLALGDERPAPGQLRVPPMLSASWSLLVEASGRDAKLIPEGSFAAAIADRLWDDGGPWLVWQRPDDKRPTARKRAASAKDLDALAESEPAQRPTDVIDQVIMRYAKDPECVNGPVPLPKKQTAQAPTFQGLVRMLGLPNSVVQSRVSALVDKLPGRAKKRGKRRRG